MGSKVSDKLGPIWGPDGQGEIAGTWRLSGHPAFWVMCGNLWVSFFKKKIMSVMKTQASLFIFCSLNLLEHCQDVILNMWLLRYSYKNWDFMIKTCLGSLNRKTYTYIYRNRNPNMNTDFFCFCMRIFLMNRWPQVSWSLEVKKSWWSIDLKALDDLVVTHCVIEA